MPGVQPEGPGGWCCLAEADACPCAGTCAVTPRVHWVPPLHSTAPREAPGQCSDTLGTWLSEPTCQWGAHVSAAGGQRKRS